MKRKTQHPSLTQQIMGVLLTYVKTQLLLILVVTGVSWGMLAMLHVEYAWFLGILTGSASVVPILGILLSAVAASAVAIFDGSRFLPGLPAIVEGIIVLLFYGILNVAIDYALAPYMIGKSAKIHPVLLLFAVIIGTAFFGFLGAILTIPLILVIKTISEHHE